MSSLNVTDQVTIFIKTDGTRVTELYDRDDVCMKAAIASFEILAKNSHGSDFHCGKEPQIVLHLRDFTATVKYATEDGMVCDFKGDEEVDVVACAVESVLKILHKKQWVGKDIISFQARRGGYLTNDLKLSRLILILLNKDATPTFTLEFKEGFISRTYAYLSERKLCLFLNDHLPSACLNKIESCLAKLFPRYNQAFKS